MGGPVGMHILVINSGSSSIKFSIFAVTDREPASLFEGEITGIGTGTTQLKFHNADGEDLIHGASVQADTIEAAVATVLSTVNSPSVPPIDAVGYRIVHPGPKLKGHQKITPAVLDALDHAASFAPLHDPVAVHVIRKAMAAFPKIDHYGCFDTVFHETMPEPAKVYALPLNLYEQGVYRYGFHGLSCESIVDQLHTLADQTTDRAAFTFPGKLIIAHLGSGCSVTAVSNGRSIDTTMGLTPTGGIVMGTRPGDLDPGVLFYLLRQAEGDINAVEDLLNHHAGVSGLSALPNDMRAIEDAAAHNQPHAALAVEVFTRSVKKAIGSFMALLGGVDALVFTGGIGEHDVTARAHIIAGLEGFAIKLDPAKNKNLPTSDTTPNIAASESKTAILVLPAEEDRMIAIHVSKMSKEPGQNQYAPSIVTNSTPVKK